MKKLIIILLVLTAGCYHNIQASDGIRMEDEGTSVSQNSYRIIGPFTVSSSVYRVAVEVDGMIGSYMDSYCEWSFDHGSYTSVDESAYQVNWTPGRTGGCSVSVEIRSSLDGDLLWSGSTYLSTGGSGGPGGTLPGEEQPIL